MEKDFFENVLNFIEAKEMLSPGDGVVAGVSGGADSVCLLRILIEVRNHFAQQYKCHRNDALYIKVVHVNHMIRGEEANRDQHFVEALCRKYDIECIVKKKDIPQLAQEMHLTEEEAGRTFRYECFKAQAANLAEELAHVRKKESGVKIAVAHNREDLAETVIYNMVRGSSLLGLSGIKPVRDNIIRPLLDSGRAEIEAYLQEIGQEYITDSTNLSTDYSRNKIRLQILPIMKEINEGAVNHIIEIANEASVLQGDIVTEISKTSSESDGKNERKIVSEEARLNIKTLQSLSMLASGELILGAMEKVCGRRKDITKKHIRSVYELSDMETGKRIDLPYDMYAERVYSEIVIRKNQNTEDSCGIGQISTITFSNSPQVNLSKKEYTKVIDCDKIRNVLSLRTAKKDDFIVINEAGGRKKMSRFFTDQKVEKSMRDRIPVVADGNEIVWVVGYRLSERYKVTPETKEVMQIDYKK